MFYEDNEIQPAAVRLYNFTTQMTAEENLSLNQNLVYLPKSEVSYTEGSDYLSGLFTVNVNDDMTKLNTVDGSGSFTYNGNQQIEVGTTVVIYDGAEAPKLGEGGRMPSPGTGSPDMHPLPEALPRRHCWIYRCRPARKYCNRSIPTSVYKHLSPP